MLFRLPDLEDYSQLRLEEEVCNNFLNMGMVNMENFIKDHNALTYSIKSEASPCFLEYPAFQNMFT